MAATASDPPEGPAVDTGGSSAPDVESLDRLAERIQELTQDPPSAFDLDAIWAAVERQIEGGGGGEELNGPGK